MSGTGPVGVVGLGLVGGSVALDLLGRGVEVVGTDLDPDERALAAAAGVAVEDTAGAVAERCDVVVVAVPTGATAGVLAELDDAAAPGTVVTDVASVKAPAALGTAGVVHRHLRHVGGHPMSGTERAGFRAARRGLFDGAPWFVTPDTGTDPDALVRTLELVLGFGAWPVLVDADEHDALVATLSHLPHVLSYGLYATLAGAFPVETELLSGGSFRDLTRVAASRPAFWSEVMTRNRSALRTGVLAMRDRLDRLADALDGDGDTAAIEALLTQGHRSVVRGRGDDDVVVTLAAGAGGGLDAEGLATLRDLGRHAHGVRTVARTAAGIELTLAPL
ncbi:MAG: prephenate dehydrogenase [Actinomycetes bacterium]